MKVKRDCSVITELEVNLYFYWSCMKLCANRTVYSTYSSLSARSKSRRAKFSDSKRSLTGKKLSWTVGNPPSHPLLPVPSKC